MDKILLQRIDLTKNQEKVQWISHLFCDVFGYDFSKIPKELYLTKDEASKYEILLQNHCTASELDFLKHKYENAKTGKDDYETKQEYARLLRKLRNYVAYKSFKEVVDYKTILTHINYGKKIKY